MDHRRERNIKQIAKARFQNPKYVFDGKRAQPVYERKTYDHSSAVIYAMHMRRNPLILAKRCDLLSQSLNFNGAEDCTVTESVTSRFLHMCINKIRSCVNALTWNHDGRRLLTGCGSGEITMWNGFSFNFDTILQAHECPVKAMSWSPSALFLLSGDAQGVLKYWNSSMNNIQRIEAHYESIKDVCFSNTDMKYASASDDATIKIWDSYTSQCERMFHGHNWDVRKAQWHPKLSLIASGGKDNLIKMWDPRVDKCIGTFHYHKNSIMAMCWFKDHCLVTGGKDQQVKRFDIRTTKEPVIYKALDTDITAVTGHPFNNSFVTGSSEGELVYWEADTEDPIFAPTLGHENAIWALEYHPAGHMLASGSSDNMVKFWGRKRPVDIILLNDDDDGYTPGIDWDTVKIPGLFNLD